jgi:hypothetical protein
MSSEESRMRGSVMTVGARLLSAVAIGTFLALSAIGCAPVGLGDPCTPEAIPAGGFTPREVYIESGSVQCRTRTCMVFHLDANPECTPNCSACAQGGSDVCPRCTPNDEGRYVCVTEGEPRLANSDERVFCSCRCSASGNPSLPLCQCTEGYRCVPDGDPGGGYCVPDEVATHPPMGLESTLICENDEECLGGLRCDAATRHCI